jgi:hypothetical protein
MLFFALLAIVVGLPVALIVVCKRPALVAPLFRNTKHGLRVLACVVLVWYLAFFGVVEAGIHVTGKQVLDLCLLRGDRHYRYWVAAAYFLTSIFFWPERWLGVFERFGDHLRK